MHVPLGLTPTRVGTTLTLDRTSASPGAHPHTRGDDGSKTIPSYVPPGSPPHAWGRLRTGQPASRSASGGLTPTRVGTTALRALGIGKGEAHPHTRGDDDDGVGILEVGGGSPPHAWGRLISASSERSASRLTPTRVGTTHGRRHRSCSTRAHPHTRGDDRTLLMIAAACRGSPPHAWGRPVVRLGRSGYFRLTPTRVGTTRARRRQPPA